MKTKNLPHAINSTLYTCTASHNFQSAVRTFSTRVAEVTSPYSIIRFRNSIVGSTWVNRPRATALDDAFFISSTPFPPCWNTLRTRKCSVMQEWEAKIVKVRLVVWSWTNFGQKHGCWQSIAIHTQISRREWAWRSIFSFFVIYRRDFSTPPRPKILIDRTLAPLLLDSSFSSITGGEKFAVNHANFLRMKRRFNRLKSLSRFGNFENNIKCTILDFHTWRFSFISAFLYFSLFIYLDGNCTHFYLFPHLNLLVPRSSCFLFNMIWHTVPQIFIMSRIESRWLFEKWRAIKRNDFLLRSLGSYQAYEFND